MPLDLPYLESSGQSTLRHTFTIDADPAALTVEFDIVQGVRGDPSGTWVAGTWASTWSAKTGWMVAKTPTIGAAGSALPAVVGDWHLYQRINSVDVLYCGKFRVA